MFRHPYMPGRDLRPDDAAERLVARECSAVVERLHLEAGHRAVLHDADLDVEEPALVAVGVRRVLVGAPLGPLDGAAELPRQQAEHDVLRVQADLVAEAAADVVGDEAKLVDPGAQCRRHPDRAHARHLVIARQRPLAGALVVLDERARAFERRRREAVEVELVDLHDVVGLGESGVDVAPVEDARPDDVRARVVVEDDLVLQGLARVDEDGQRVVLDLDELGGVAREVPGRSADSRDRLAHVPHATDRERVVLDVPARLDGHLEERVGVDRDLVARDRPVDAFELERLRDVDGDDLRVAVGRADEVDVAHPVPADVVEERALPLDEPLVLLARDRLPDEPLLERLGGLGDRRRHPLPERGGTHGSPASPSFGLRKGVLRASLRGNESRFGDEPTRRHQPPPPRPVATTASTMFT